MHDSIQVNYHDRDGKLLQSTGIEFALMRESIAAFGATCKAATAESIAILFAGRLQKSSRLPTYSYSTWPSSLLSVGVAMMQPCRRQQ